MYIYIYIYGYVYTYVGEGMKGWDKGLKRKTPPIKKEKKIEKEKKRKEKWGFLGGGGLID